MDETDINPPRPSSDNAPATGGGDSRTVVALSEENLLALLGSPATARPSAKPAAAPASPKPPLSEPPVPVEFTLARLSSVQPPVVQPPVEHKAPLPASAPVPPVQAAERPAPLTQPAAPAQMASPAQMATPVQKAPVSPVHSAAPATVPAAASRRTSPSQPPQEGIDNTLALIAAIRENRAGLLRSEAASKPAPQATPAAVPAPKLAPPAKADPAPRPDLASGPALSPVTPVSPAKSVPEKTIAPAALTISERIDRHPAIPGSRKPAGPTGNASPSAEVFGAKPVTAPPQPLSLIDRLPGGRISLLIAGAVIAIGGISTGLILRSHRTAPTARAGVTAPGSPGASASNFPLQLQLETLGKGQINVHWNPLSTLIAQAREGRLVITENNQAPRTIPLGLDQLKMGHWMYQPLTDRVEFRLEVVDASGAIAEESVLSLGAPVVSGEPPPSPASPAPAATTAPVVVSTVPASSATASKAGPAPTVAAPAPAAAARPAPRAFAPPPVNRTTEQGSITDAPPVVAGGPSAPLFNAQVPRGLAPPPAPAASPTPAPAKLQVESSLQSAKLLRRVTPVYPPLAKSARVQGTIRFRATIAKDGTVQNLEAVAGPALLRQSAIDAVKQWKYQPTLLNGQPVEVVTSIEVAFTLGQ